MAGQHSIRPLVPPTRRKDRFGKRELGVWLQSGTVQDLSKVIFSSVLRAKTCAFTSHGIHDPYGSWKDGRVLSTPPFCLCHHRVPVLMVCEPMATKIAPWSHPSKGYVHPTHGARGNGYLVEMCCLPSCLEDTAPPETGRFARNDRKVIIAPPLSTVLSLDYYKVQGQEAFRKLPSFPPPKCHYYGFTWVRCSSILGASSAKFLGFAALPRRVRQVRRR